MKVAHSFYRIIFLSLLPLLACWGQEALENTDPSTLDPSDVYFQSWMALRDADEHQKKEEFERAFEAATRSKRLTDTVTLYHPQWKPHLVTRKRKEVVSKLEKLATLLPNQAASALPLYQRNHSTPQNPTCLLYTSPSPRDQRGSRMPSSA